MTTRENAFRKTLLSKFHAMCKDANKKEAIKNSYGVESMSTLDVASLKEIIRSLEDEQRTDPIKQELDQKRKRVMAIIGAYMRKNGYDETAEKIKTMACKIAGVPATDFNRITLNRLGWVYGVVHKLINDKKEMARTITEIQTEEMINN
jgi:hypothetical protein